MRKAILASLALSPVLLHAQAKSPAQPKNVLESRLAAPAELSGAGDRTTSTKALRISTGVVAPKLIHSIDVPLDNYSSLSYSGPRHVVVGMIVGKDGVPSNLRIVESAGPLIDKNVLAAVSQYRFTPGTVSNQAVEIPLNLDITLVGTAR
ncbi:MAG TPA: energy transducer TonB [Edaphobacter sp.]